MERLGWKEQWRVLFGLLGIVIHFFSLTDGGDLHGRYPEKATREELKYPPLQLHTMDEKVVMDNGLVNVTLSTSDGVVTGISYQGHELLETLNGETDRGYWDVVWNQPESSSASMDRLLGTTFKVIMQSESQIELSFTRTWSSSASDSQVPLNIDKRFVLLHGSSGFYTYAILERLEGCPGFDIQEGRIAFKLQKNKFHYMALSDERQRIMPMPEDRENGQVLAYPEAVLLTNPINPDLKGEVDDKYLYSCLDEDNRVHGWVSNELAVGFWMITPSNEFRTGGPLNQDLTSHVGPITLSMFISTHYAGEELALKFENGEPWKKVFGPVFVYLNSDGSARDNPSVLWDDGKKRMLNETASWPYNFPQSKDFYHSAERAAVRGQLLVHDRYINKQPVSASAAYVGLARPGKRGSWQTESKGYQFWTRGDSDGSFTIKNVIPGSYNLFAWVPGFIGNYKYTGQIIVTPGTDIKLNGLVYEPPRNGVTLWEIGTPDCTASEFYVPGPSPSFKINAYQNNYVEKYRQYGLWERYADLYPHKDLVYTVGVSDYKTDWFFAHVTRNMGNDTYQGTTWKILFNLRSANKAGNYTLRLALASANDAELEVRFNDPDMDPPTFGTGLIGKDNAIARHGIHGLPLQFNISVPGSQLVSGRNTIFLTQLRNTGPFHGIMYDYIRLEAPQETH